MNTVTVVIILTLVGLVASQGMIDFPCNPAAPSNECTGSPHLVCTPMFNHYSEGTCRCESGTFWHTDTLDECRVGANLSCSTSSGAAACTPSSSCKADGDSSDDVCVCDDGYYPQAVGSYCVVGYNRPCANAAGQFAKCDGPLELVCAGSDPVNRVCACAGARVWSEPRGKCVVTVESSNSCAVNDDCVDNAFCDRPNFGIARCRCADGFSKTAQGTCSLAHGTTCDPSGGMTVRCNQDEHLECSATNNTCLCADSRVLTFGSCLGVVDHECEEHGDCTGGAICHAILNKCFCSQQLGMIQLIDRTCGRLGRAGYCRLGGFDDCPATEHLRCNPIEGTTYGRCECIEGMVSDENGRCLQVAGASCASGNQNCVPNAACIQGVCSCIPGTALTTVSRCLRMFNQPCDTTRDNQCHPDKGLNCVNATCVCPAGQEWSSRMDRCVALVSGACAPVTGYCVDNTVCSRLGFCQCAPGYAQRSPEDRHCAPSHGTTCHPTTAPCNAYQFLTCPLSTNECVCQFPLHQTWDSARAECVSVLGGPCGPLDEHDGRELHCIETSVCKSDLDLVAKCVCDVEAGMEPDGEGKCRLKEDPTTTTTTTTETPTTSTTTLPSTTTSTIITSTTMPESDGVGALSTTAGGLLLALCTCALILFM